MICESERMAENPGKGIFSQLKRLSRPGGAKDRLDNPVYDQDKQYRTDDAHDQKGLPRTSSKIAFAILVTLDAESSS